MDVITKSAKPHLYISHFLQVKARKMLRKTCVYIYIYINKQVSVSLAFNNVIGSLQYKCQRRSYLCIYFTPKMYRNNTNILMNCIYVPRSCIDTWNHFYNTRRKLFQKRVVLPKLDIYVYIKPYFTKCELWLHCHVCIPKSPTKLVIFSRFKSSLEFVLCVIDISTLNKTYLIFDLFDIVYYLDIVNGSSIWYI